MSKAGIDVMTKSLAVEWAKFGVRLNAVGPGEIPTEGMSKRLNPGEEPGARSRENNPMARPGEMRELQNLAAFLMAPGQCDWLTGQSIMMDGGSALATGGNFYELRSWSDADWQQARERIEAQNAKDRAQRCGRRHCAMSLDRWPPTSGGTSPTRRAVPRTSPARPCAA
jgi:hypothetical protein